MLFFYLTSLLKPKMKICYFGIYNPDYSRSRVLLKGLRENGAEVIECQITPTERFKYWKLFKGHRQIKNYDLMIIGYPNTLGLTLLSKLICRKKIVLDAFVSFYDSVIKDRKVYSSYSFRALKYWLLDWLGCKFADVILLDTEAHINYFVKEFGIKGEKFKRIFISCDEAIFYPQPRLENIDQFLVHFHGTFIPLQGIEYIIKAAKLLEGENIQFNLIGSGQTHQMVVDLSRKLKTKNVNFINFMPQKELVKYMAQADVCLGIFGSTSKATRVIPNKAYEAIAMKKPVITADSPAIRELFENRKNCLFCNIADEKDLAEKILELKNNPELRKKIAEGGYKLFKERLTPKILGKDLKNILEELL